MKVVNKERKWLGYAIWLQLKKQWGKKLKQKNNELRKAWTPIVNRAFCIRRITHELYRNKTKGPPPL